VTFDTPSQILVIILAIFLAVFLLLAIIFLAILLRVIRQISTITKTAQHTAEQFDSLASRWGRVAAPLAISRFVGKMMGKLARRRGHPGRTPREKN